MSRLARSIVPADPPEEIPRDAALTYLLPAPEALRQATAQRDLSAGLDYIAAQLYALPDISGVAIALQRERQMVCVTSVGTAPAVGTTLDGDTGLSAACIRSGLPIYCADAASDPRIDPAVSEALKLRSLLILPVRPERTVTGLLEVFSSVVDRFPAENRSAWEQVAALITSMTVPPASPPNTSPASISPLPVSSSVEPIAAFALPTEPSPVATGSASPAFTLSSVSAGETSGIGGFARRAKEIGGWLRERPALLVVGMLFLVFLVALLNLPYNEDEPAAPSSAQPSNTPDLSPLRIQPKSPSPATPAPGKREHDRAKPTSPARSRSHDSGKASDGPVSQTLVPAASSTVRNVSEREEEPPATEFRADRTLSLPIPLAATAPSVRPGTVRTEITGGRLVKQVLPSYPLLAHLHNVYGAVRLVAQVNEKGAITSVEPVDGPEALRLAAEQAVRKWRYEPLLVNGKPTARKVTVQVRFVP